MNHKLNTKSRLTLSFVLIVFATVAYAQPNSAGVFEEVTDTPINAGIAMMALAGIGYGLKQLRNRKK